MQDKICDSFLVHDFFITDLGLSGVELLTFSLVYSFCRGGLGSYYGSVGYLRKRLGICERSVQRSLCALVEKGLLAKNTSPLRSIPHYSITDAVIEARERRLNSKLQEESGLWEQTIKGKNDGDGVQDIRPLGDNAAGGRWQGDTQDNISDKIEDNINSNNTNYPSFCKAHTCVKLDRENEDVAFGSFGRPEGEEEGWEHSALLTDGQQENDCTSGGGGQIGLSHRRGNDGTAGGGGQAEHSRDRLAKEAGGFGDGLAGKPSYLTDEEA